MSNVFNQDALNTNRQGRLTLSQSIGLVPMILIGGIFFIIAVGILGILIYSLITHTFKGSILVGVIFDGGISLFLFWLAFMVSGRRLIDMLIGQVRHVEGRATKYAARGSRGGRILHYSVGKEDFQIAWSGTWEALHGEAMVRAYYTPFSKTLVNVEPILSQSSPPESAGGNLIRDEELEGLQKLEKAEMESRKQKKK